MLYGGNVYSLLPGCLGYKNHKLFWFGNSVGVGENNTCSVLLTLLQEHYSHTGDLHSNEKQHLRVFIYYINRCALYYIDQITDSSKVGPISLLTSSFVIMMDSRCHSSWIIFLPYSFTFTHYYSNRVYAVRYMFQNTSHMTWLVIWNMKWAALKDCPYLLCEVVCILREACWTKTPPQLPIWGLLWK